MTRSGFRAKWWLAICALGVCGSLFAAGDQVRIIPAEELKLWWQSDPASPHSPLPYPTEALKEGIEGCLAVAFEIHTNGGVSNERIWRDTLPQFGSSPFFDARKALGQAALLAVHRWHFIPAPANKAHDSVYTYQIVTFTLTGSSPKWTDRDQHRHDELEAKCKVPDFTREVEAMINTKQPGAHP